MKHIKEKIAMTWIALLLCYAIPLYVGIFTDIAKFNSLPFQEKILSK
jgi:hypothetical protein